MIVGYLDLFDQHLETVQNMQRPPSLRGELPSSIPPLAPRKTKAFGPKKEGTGLAAPEIKRSSSGAPPPEEKKPDTSASKMVKLTGDKKPFKSDWQPPLKLTSPSLGKWWVQTLEYLHRKGRAIPKGRYLNVAIIGWWGTGKSSVVNSLRTAFSTGLHPVRESLSQPGGTHGTFNIIRVDIPETRIKLVDMQGVTSDNYPAGSFRNILSGQTPNVDGKFSDIKGREGEIRDNKIHAAILVVSVQSPLFGEVSHQASFSNASGAVSPPLVHNQSSTNAGMDSAGLSADLSSTLPKTELERLREIIHEVQDHGIKSVTTVLTCLDTQNSRLMDRAEEMYTSENVLRSVSMMSKLDVATRNVFPVKPYTKERERSKCVELMLLVALKHALENAKPLD
jgi:hypothetical protein